MRTPNIPIPARMFDVGGLAYKFRTVGFVDRRAAEKAGLSLEAITSPYTLWNSAMPTNTYYVFGADSVRELRESQSRPKFKQLSEDARYAKLFLYYNN